MATVDPRYFDWGARFQEGQETAKRNRLQDIAFGQQQEDRAMAMEDRSMRLNAMRQQQEAQQAENQYATQLREATTLLNTAKALKGVPLERRRQALEQWGARNPIIAGALQQIPPETDLSDAGLDEFAASMGIAVQGYGSPQGNSDFLRAVEILRNPNAPQTERAAAEIALGLKARAGADAITPYQQAQLDLERQKLGAKETSDATKASSAVTDKIKVATGTARAKQMYSGIDAARGTLVNLVELENAIDQGAQFGPLASRVPSFSGATQRGDRALANLALSNIKQLPGPASDKDIAFIRQSSISDTMDEKTMKELIPQLRAAAERVIEKNMRVAAMIEQGMTASEAEAEVWGTGAPGPGIVPQGQQTPQSQPRRLKYNPATGALE